MKFIITTLFSLLLACPSFAHGYGSMPAYVAVPLAALAKAGEALDNARDHVARTALRVKNKYKASHKQAKCLWLLKRAKGEPKIHFEQPNRRKGEKGWRFYIIEDGVTCKGTSASKEEAKDRIKKLAKYKGRSLK